MKSRGSLGAGGIVPDRPRQIGLDQTGADQGTRRIVDRDQFDGGGKGKLVKEEEEEEDGRRGNELLLLLLLLSWCEVAAPRERWLCC